jgi:uroporphyrinogen decarboxylase
MNKTIDLLERERVLLSIAHRETDRTPTDFWATPEMTQKLYDYFGLTRYDELLDRLGIDIREVHPDYIGPQSERLPDGSVISTNGTHMKPVRNEYCTYWEYASHPLEHMTTPKQILEYPRWPSAAWYDWDHFADKIGALRERYYVKIQLGGPFEYGWGMRGMERFMMDMVDEPDMAHAVMRSIANYFIDFITRALTAAGDKIDLVYTYDDIASQHGLLMSPSMWEEFIAPYHREIDRVIHGFGKTIMYHSCGAVYPMIERLMALPIEILNPLQPQADGMDLGKIKANFGDRLAFHGAIDIQGVLPHGTPQDVAQAVRDAIRILGRDGGYILSSSHYIQADTPPENVEAMYLANADRQN